MSGPTKTCSYVKIDALLEKASWKLPHGLSLKVH